MDTRAAMIDIILTNPSIKVTRDRIIASTPIVDQAFRLFSEAIYVSVDKPRQVIEVTRRHFWKTACVRTIPFAEVQYIDWAHSTCPEPFMYRFMGGPHGAVDLRGNDLTEAAADTISVVLHASPARIPLIRFQGFETSFLTHLSPPGAMERLQPQCQLFVDTLADMLSVPVGEPFALRIKDGSSPLTCPSCGHPNHPDKAACVYCGERLAEQKV